VPDVIKLSLQGDGATNFKLYIQDRLQEIKNGLRELHEVKLPEWRRIYEARPLESKKVFPFENASNLVPPLVGIHSDTLKARLMASIFRVRPIWSVKLHGDFAGEAERLRMAVEDFMSSIAIEPDELDLYRVYNEALDDVIQYGTMFVKLPWETNVVDVVTGSPTGFSFIPETLYDGPRPEKIAFEDFFMSPSEKTIERADFKAQRKRMQRWDIEDRVFRGLYDSYAAKAILSTPDRPGPTTAQRQVEMDSSIKSPRGPVGAEWDIYECWFWYRDGRRKTKVVATYHLHTNTLLRAFYTFLPDDPFLGARLLLRDGLYHGYGMCEYLGMFQEEISQIHNQRRDASTVANAKVWRVDPFSKLHDGYKIYPSAMLPAAKDEIEPMAHGDPSPMNIEEERLALELAERRSGISPPMQSYGSGSFSKRGVYSAMGTLSLLQEGNNRTDLSVGDIRYFHTKLGRMIARQYAALGLNSSRFEEYGRNGDLIKEALKAILGKKMFLPISSPSASVNREVEKQSDVMLVNLMTKHYQMIAQMMAQATQQGMPPEVQQYLVKAVKAANALMKTVLKHFDYDDPDIYSPEVSGGAEEPGAGQGPQPAALQQVGSAGMVGGQGGGLPGIPGLAELSAGIQPAQGQPIQ
jgi:hypothetical protein